MGRDSAHPRDVRLFAVAPTPTPASWSTPGSLHNSPYLACGCDACDDTAASQADEIRSSLSRRAGTARECEGGTMGRYGAAGAPDGSRYGSSSTRLCAAALVAGWRRLRSLRHGWGPWPMRGDSQRQ
ncbi:DUF6226 family protein [Georgenia ruanii]|uniref:DUF6226 family protein n=1 Tax=Georgenia ruanii TaxID=348442 RepID=UPI001D012AE0|nr:DUF6226 family protein [Georgenia ruanii]